MHIKFLFKFKWLHIPLKHPFAVTQGLVDLFNS